MDGILLFDDGLNPEDGDGGWSAEKGDSGVHKSGDGEVGRGKADTDGLWDRGWMVRILRRLVESRERTPRSSE